MVNEWRQKKKQLKKAARILSLAYGNTIKRNKKQNQPNKTKQLI
jgi:hypothetical protein